MINDCTFLYVLFAVAKPEKKHDNSTTTKHNNQVDAIETHTYLKYRINFISNNPKYEEKRIRERLTTFE